MTFSIVARSEDGVYWGVAVASKFLAVGNAVPAAFAGVGAIATQADANVAYKGDGLGLLMDGLTADAALEELLAADDGRNDRQVGIVDADGTAATYTGSDCFDWAGGLSGPGYAIQGNILTGPEVVAAMETAWNHTEDLPFAHRLLETLSAGDEAGGDRRGRQSAALLVVREGGGHGGRDDVAVDLRCDDSASPINEVRRLLELNDFYLTAPAEDQKVPVDEALNAELAAFARAQGVEHFREWVGAQNYERRVAPGLKPEWIDQSVLAIVRGEV